MDNARPFTGIEVVEFGQFIAVPFCAQVLSEGGAHVVKVESLEGDPVRQLAPLAPGETRHFISRNRGKHSLPLDLRHPSAGPIVERLLARADVVLTNFRPGLAAELGLDWASLAPRYPRLVVGNVSAFGRRGPAARLAGMDLVVQARSGLLAASGGVRDGVPTGGENPVVDYMCAMTLAFGIATALLRRANTGRGGQVDVSLLMAALMIQNNNMVRIESADGVAHAAIRARLEGLRATGRPYAEQAALTPQIRPPGTVNVYYRTYATRDAAIAVACGSPALRRAFIRAVALTDEALDRPIADREQELQHYAARRGGSGLTHHGRVAGDLRDGGHPGGRGQAPARAPGRRTAARQRHAPRPGAPRARPRARPGAARLDGRRRLRPGAGDVAVRVGDARDPPRSGIFERRSGSAPGRRRDARRTGASRLSARRSRDPVSSSRSPRSRPGDRRARCAARSGDCRGRW